MPAKRGRTISSFGQLFGSISGSGGQPLPHAEGTVLLFEIPQGAVQIKEEPEGNVIFSEQPTGTVILDLKVN